MPGPRRKIALPAAPAAIAAALVALLLAACGSGSSEPAPAPPPEAHSAAPVRKAIWGPVLMPSGRSAFPVYEELGVDVFQDQLRWAEIAPDRPADPADPSDPAYRWPPEVDRAIREASSHGIEVALMLTTAPGWANGGRAEIHAPDRPSDFAEFAAAAARRYPQVHHWMIWGEPNRSDRFQPIAGGSPEGPRRYAELLDAAYGALKESSPRNVVIGGTIFTGGDIKPPAYIRWMKLPDGRPPRLDWFGANPYPFRLPDLAKPPLKGGWRDISDLDTLEREVDAAYRPLGIEPPLWLSEFTVQTGQDSRYFAYHVDDAEQAEWLKAGYRAAEEAGNVAGLGWFSLLDQPRAAEDGYWGLLTAEEERKPSFRAYASILGR